MIGQPHGHVSGWNKRKIVVYMTSISIQRFNEIPISQKGKLPMAMWHKFGLRSATQKVGVVDFKVVWKHRKKFLKTHGEKRLKQYSN